MCQHGGVNARRIASPLGVAALTWGAPLNAPTLVADASAAPCPDVEVTFARATNEPPDVGAVGQQFIEALRSQVGGRSIGVYPVNYPAGEDFAPSASAGGSDVHARAVHGRELPRHQAGARRIFVGRHGDRRGHHRPSPDCGFDSPTSSPPTKPITPPHSPCSVIRRTATSARPSTRSARGTAPRPLTCARPVTRCARRAEPWRCLHMTSCFRRCTCPMRTPECPVRQQLSWRAISDRYGLPVRSRCLQPGQQQGRRWPSSSSSWVRRMRP